MRKIICRRAKEVVIEFEDKGEIAPHLWRSVFTFEGNSYNCDFICCPDNLPSFARVRYEHDITFLLKHDFEYVREESDG